MARLRGKDDLGGRGRLSAAFLRAAGLTSHLSELEDAFNKRARSAAPSLMKYLRGPELLSAIRKAHRARERSL